MLRDMDFTLRHYLKNRTIVSRDIKPILDDIAAICGEELKLHSFRSGSEHGTWIVPPRWDVVEAWIKGPDGTLMASYDDHPLFLAPYSMPFEGRVSLNELRRHLRVHETFSDVYIYEHRLAYDFTKRLKDWAISLPRNVVDGLEEGDYEVKIDVEVEPGDMLVGEIVLPGSSDRSIALLADYCHPGLVNDSWSGILALMDVVSRLKDIPDRRYTYRFLIFPETIGSCVLLDSKPEYIDTVDLAIFSEFVGWGRQWKALASTKPDGLAMKLSRLVAKRFDGLESGDLWDGFGNDERIFDFAGVPSMSVQMMECDEYHTSRDEPGRLEQENIDQAADIIFSICRMMEANATLAFKQRVPFQMSRFDLYANSVHRKQAFEYNRSILYGLKGGKSLIDIADETNVPFDYVRDYAQAIIDNKLAVKK